MKGTCRWIPLALVAIIAAGCDDDPSEPSDPQPLDQQALMTVLGGGGTADTDGVRACPAGGEIEVQSDGRVDIDGDIATVTFESTYEHRECAHIVDGDRMVSDGSVAYDGVQRLQRQENGRSELIQSEIHQVGRMHIRYRDYDRTCDVDLTQTLIADRDVIRFSGTICGHPIEAEAPRFRP